MSLSANFLPTQGANDMAKNLEPHQERMLQEEIDLDKKIIALNKFIAGPTFSTLDAAEQERIQRQLTHMGGYLKALHERIDAFAFAGT